MKKYFVITLLNKVDYTHHNIFYSDEYECIKNLCDSMNNLNIFPNEIYYTVGIATDLTWDDIEKYFK